MGRHMNFHKTTKVKRLYEGKSRVRKYTIEWTLDSSLALIRAVHRTKLIWDPSNPYYKHKVAKNESWDRIAKTIKIPRDELMLRWNALRGNYIAYLKKGKECRTDESASKLRRVNPLYSEMGFLNSVLRTEATKRGTSARRNPSPVKANSYVSISENNDSPARASTPTPIPELPPDPPTAPPPQPAQKRPPTPPQQTERVNNFPGQSTMGGMMMNAYDLLMKTAQSTDEWDAFGNMIACNARSWAMENVGFARRYKAALAAVNAKFEQEAAELSAADEYIVH